MDIAAYESRRKSTLLAYILWFFLGSLGMHRFYAGAWRTGLVLLLIHAAGWAAIGLAWTQTGHRWHETVTGPGYSSTVIWSTITPDSPLGMVGSALLGLVGVWVFVDLFLTYGLIKRYNTSLAGRVGV